MAKLQPLLEQMDRVAELNVKWAESIVDFLSKNAASQPDAGLFRALEQQTGKIMAEINTAHDKYFEEFKKAEGLLIGFIKKPG